MRSRLHRPGFFQNEQLASCTPHARLLFIGLWEIADREGRFEDRPRRIRAEVFPYEPEVDVGVLLDELERSDDDGTPFVQRYSVDGRDYGWIPKFLEHQTPHHRELPSAIPPPPGHVQGRTLPRPRHGPAPTQPGQSPDPGEGQPTPRNGLGNHVESPKPQPGQGEASTQARPSRAVSVSVSVSRSGKGEGNPDPALRAPPTLSPDLLEALQAATGKALDDPDLDRFLKSVQRYPQARIDAAVREFLSRGPEVHRKPLASYLRKMVAEGAGGDLVTGSNGSTPTTATRLEDRAPATPPPATPEDQAAHYEAIGRAAREREEAAKAGPNGSAEDHKGREP